MPGLRNLANLRAALPTLFAPAAGVRALGLAVSGGADSLALLLLATQWAAGLAHPPALFVYTVDHGLRVEAADEAAFVAGEATRLGVPARVMRWEEAKPAAGVQAAARAARYRLMGQAMHADGATLLLTAHHRSDQAETVLMRLAHGSGLGGLRGMDAMADVEGVRVFRPLLDVSATLLRQVVVEAGLTPVTDPSNLDRHYERVRWRQEMPRLAELGLGDERLAQFARRAGEADDAVRQWAEERFTALVTRDPLGAASVPLDKFAGLPPAVGVKLLARLLDLTGGGQKPRALGAVERLHQQITGARTLPATTTLGVSIRRRGDTLWFSREAGRHAGAAVTVPPSESLLWDRRFRIRNGSATPFSVRMAREFSRDAAERMVGVTLLAPSAAIRSAPIVSDAGGTPLALGCHRLSENVFVEFAGDMTPLSQS